MKKKTRRGSILRQVAVLFAVSILLTVLLAYFLQYSRSASTVRERAESLAAEVSEEVRLSIEEYPGHEWLLPYWYGHADELDIEYDAEFGEGSLTEEKCRLLQEHAPDLQLKYADVSDLEALSGEDQKLYAEIAYSWLLTRVDEIKKAYHMDYLFCVLSDEPYDKQFFLFSAAEPGAVRGRGSDEAYTLGTEVSVSASQQAAMRDALKNMSHMADAGEYVDYYVAMGSAAGHPVLLGMTYNVTDLLSDIRFQTWNGTAFAILYQVVLSLLCMALIFAFVLKPLKNVQQNIRLYMRTKDSSNIRNNLAALRTNNEIGVLAEDVAALTEEIEEYLEDIETITAEKERISTELSLATRIQASMLPGVFPAFPERSEFDLFASMDPAREVGGDFYDFFLVDKDHLCLLIADVSGKGIPAALYMMATRILLANNVRMGKSPAAVLKDSNDSICANNPEEMFVTVWLGILDLSTGMLTAANAGHEFPVLKLPDGRFELLKDKHGFVLGGLEGMRYKDYEVQMQPGSKLFLHTDGVTEAMNGEHALFGRERMLEALNEDPDAAPEQLVLNVRGAIDLFADGMEQADDLTMLCFVYNGENKMLTNELDIEAAAENLPQVLQFIESRLEAAGCSRKAKMQIAIAAEEIYINIASYAYAPDKGRAWIDMNVSDDQKEVSITFKDKGMPYNPLEKEDPDVTLSAEERQIGGLGTFMTKKFMDEMLYEYKDGMNILTLKKRLQ
ncbi:MAG: SpoIIE family protein phosphatase [Firmicutes bacterium]|nr:SpoIIE family protein phosphatase [Bacillota bacterium]